MRQFLKFTLASMTGLVLGSIVLFLIMMMIVGGIVASAGKGKEAKVKENSILHMQFDSPVTDRTNNNPLANFAQALEGKQAIGLNDILASIDRAAKDDHIEGIYLEVDNMPAGMAMIEEIRNKLISFKESGKFIVAYSDYYGQSAYYLASVADKIYVNPQGIVDFRGLSANLLFLKDMLAKLEIEPQIIRHGKFKSAVEPFMLDKMSEENRIQTRGFIGSMWNHMLAGVSATRNITTEQLQFLADSLVIQKAEDAVTYKLVDQLAYKDEVLEDLRERTEAETVEDLHRVSFADYAGNSDKKDDDDDNKQIAVIYAIGAIQGGEGDEETIGSDKISKAIRDARQDEDIKAIVLRINSPGGSALASEVIWREVVLAKKEKPVIVSMGNVAASGGYYIACGADTIVAEPNTITGSIGVFGVLLNAQQFFKNKLGITFDTVNTAAYADLGSATRPLTEVERQVIQNSVEHVYDVFVERVSDGRGISKEMVDSIGQGRVWSGADAKRIGLVDVLGGLDTAIAIAARKVDLEKYHLIEMPVQEDPFAKFFGNMRDEARQSFIRAETGEFYTIYQQMKNLTHFQGIQARMPFEVEIH